MALQAILIAHLDGLARGTRVRIELVVDDKTDLHRSVRLGTARQRGWEW